MPTYSEEFKLQVVKRRLINEEPVATIAKSLNIGPTSIVRWCEEYIDKIGDETTSDVTEAKDAQIDELKNTIKSLKKEIRELKKQS